LRVGWVGGWFGCGGRLIGFWVGTWVRGFRCSASVCSASVDTAQRLLRDVRQWSAAPGEGFGFSCRLGCRWGGHRPWFPRLLIAAALHEAGASSVLHRWYAHTSCNLFALAHRALPLFSVSRSKAALPGTRLVPRLVPHPTAVDTIGTRPNSRLFSYVLDLDVAALPGGPKTADRTQAE
jgi:hypothetical protein